jgi:ERCC4-related helicase
MPVKTSEKREMRLEEECPVAPYLSPRQRSEIQFSIVAQRAELRVALARVLRERWRLKVDTGLEQEDARSAGDWLDLLSQHTIQSVSEEHEGDRQFALTRLAATALAALEASHRKHGELRGAGEIDS